MGYISTKREEKNREKKVYNIIFSSIYIFLIVFAICILFYSSLFQHRITRLLDLIFLILKLGILSFIAMIFYIIISILILSISFHFEKKILYFFYKIKYRNNMNDVNYAYLCEKLKNLILISKMSKKKVEKETSFLLRKNTLRNEEIKRNLNILENKEEIKRLNEKINNCIVNNSFCFSK